MLGWSWGRKVGWLGKWGCGGFNLYDVDFVGTGLGNWGMFFLGDLGTGGILHIIDVHDFMSA